MTINFEKVAEAIEKASPEIKNLMFSAELADKIGIIAEENKMEEEVAFKFIDEVGYVILDLKSKTSFFSSLTEIGIDKSIASLIEKEVNEKIFSELDKIKNTENSQEKPKETKPQNNVGTSFEQIILNQAKAMQPARLASESVAGGPARPAGWVPQNLPTQEPPKVQQEDKPKAIHNYIGESDPYREPVE